MAVNQNIAAIGQLRQFKLVHKVCEELSTGFVLFSVPSGNQSVSTITYRDSYLY